MDCLDATLSGMPGVNATLGVMPRIQANWSAQFRFAQKFAPCRAPYVVSGSVISEWPASTRWQSTSYIAEALTDLDDVYVSDVDEANGRIEGLSQVIVDATGQMHAAWKSTEEPTESQGMVQLSEDPSGDEEKSMPSVDFFKAGSATAVYYARFMGDRKLTALRADVQPHDTLLIDDEPDGLRSTETMPSSESSIDRGERRYFRLGSAGSSSSLHYDEYHNCFVQVVGAKRWFLMPPRSWSMTWGFPKGHGRYRQSPRTPVYEWSDAERLAAGVLDVTTHEGDVLYVPPFFFHQVVTLQRSVAVNLWSASSESQLSAKARTVVDGSVLLGASSKEATLCVVARLVAAIAGQLRPANAVDLLHHIYKAQYAHLLTRKRSVSRAPSNFTAPQGCGMRCGSPSDGELTNAERIGQTLLALPLGVQELALADLVADLTEHAASGVPPNWPGDKGRAAVLKCVITQAQTT
jgi:hypothetical protein